MASFIALLFIGVEPRENGVSFCLAPFTPSSSRLPASNSQCLKGQKLRRSNLNSDLNAVVIQTWKNVSG